MGCEEVVEQPEKDGQMTMSVQLLLEHKHVRVFGIPAPRRFPVTSVNIHCRIHHIDADRYPYRLGGVDL